MIALRRLFAVWCVLTTICFMAPDQLVPTALAQAGKQAAPMPASVQVDLLRGLADIFSRGLDTLAVRLNSQGYSARVYSTDGWQTVARQTAERATRGHKDIVVLIGHSLGGNAVLQVADALDRRGIAVELVVVFDATEPMPVPKNVLHIVNFYQNNGFGKPLVAGPGFKGELSNIDLSADSSIRHVTIEKSPRLQAQVVAKIQEVVNKDLQAKLKTTKKKKKKAPKPQAVQQ
ncbi:MAG TPA: alpha/beta hydrolase [Xanthobacteraceae bacterium]|jgi:pimeloyl-ACP methyl ester carboxylesterase|nr:alpha/beta hydrolase [Xanthobacteraceae bacterium]